MAASIWDGHYLNHLNVLLIAFWHNNTNTILLYYITRKMNIIVQGELYLKDDISCIILDCRINF